jgi:hypothetical protein
VPAGAIAGGVVGSLAFIALVAGGIFVGPRWRRQLLDRFNTTKVDVPVAADPPPEMVRAWRSFTALISNTTVTATHVTAAAPLAL